MKYMVVFVLLFSILSALMYWYKTPLENTEWEAGQETNATISITSTKLSNNDSTLLQQVVIRNMRDYDWSQHQELKGSGYRDIHFKLSELKSLKVAVSHFSAISELAHVFLLFELENGESFGLSVEARREKGEEYTLRGGLLAQFELVYLIATERDLVGLRKERNEKIYIYPIRVKEKNIQKLFEVVASKTNQINDKAEFYHLFLKNCTTQIVDLVDKISNKKFPKFAQSFAPGNAGHALYEMGLIDIEADSFEVVQKIALLK